jgi:formylglycine-generating enzyme required for sulfatase activity
LANQRCGKKLSDTSEVSSRTCIDHLVLKALRYVDKITGVGKRIGPELVETPDRLEEDEPHPPTRGGEMVRPSLGRWRLLGKLVGVVVLGAVLVFAPGCRSDSTGTPGPSAGSEETDANDSRGDTPQPGPSQQTPMIRVAGGDYVIGSDRGVPPTPADERPAHTVSLKPFAIDKYEVTNAQFTRFMNALGVDLGETGEDMNIENDRGELIYEGTDDDAHINRVDKSFVANARYEDHPANEVTWYGGRDYCAWRKAHLPTEAEWEAAARGFERRRYPWGDEPPTDERARFGAGWNETAPVDSHPAGATPDGIQDLAGTCQSGRAPSTGRTLTRRATGAKTSR